ncbi:MAG: hypothetical protein ACOVOC_08400 [Rhabdaerophilum sp.]
MAARRNRGRKRLSA